MIRLLSLGMLVLILFCGLGLVACNQTGEFGPDDDDDAADDDDATDDDDVSDDDDDDADDDDDLDDDDDKGEGANISGIVVRRTDLVLDGEGVLTVRLRSAPPGQGGQEATVALISISDADLSDKNSEVEFLFEDVEVREKPYFVVAFLDDDESGGPPSEVDLRSTPAEVLVDEEGDYNVVVELTGVGGAGGPGGDDDDSAGDDDDDSAP